MYTQFFGNYLLNRGVATTEQLVDAMKIQSSERLSIGTLAIHAGYMTASEVENVYILQTHHDIKFGELAVSEGYLTVEQVEELLHEQGPNYLLLGQTLVSNGVLTPTQLETLLLDYEAETDINTSDISVEQQENIHILVKNFLHMEDSIQEKYIVGYLSLFFNNLIRFIGDDFTPLSPILSPEVPLNYCVSQEISGDFNLVSCINMEPATAIEFASHYADDEFDEFDEYVQASIEDFLNLHNGLFNVNMSNNYSDELSLAAPITLTDPVYCPENVTTYLIPIAYSFGIMYLILSF